MSHHLNDGIAALKWRQGPRVASLITSLRLPGLGVGGECLDLPRKFAESSLSEGREFALAAVPSGPLAGLGVYEVGGRSSHPAIQGKVL